MPVIEPSWIHVDLSGEVGSLSGDIRLVTDFEPNQTLIELNRDDLLASMDFSQVEVTLG